MADISPSAVGPLTTKKELIEKSGLETLEDRRKTLFKNFCPKLYENPSFKNQWLQEREFIGTDLRRQLILKEENARPQRLYNSPLFQIRRTLNDLLVK